MYRRILELPDGWPYADAILPHVQSFAQNLSAEFVIPRFEAKTVIEMKFSKLETADMRVSFLVPTGTIANPVLAIAGSAQVESRSGPLADVRRCNVGC